MAGFHPDNGFLIHKRMVLTEVRAADPGTYWVAAVFITKLAREHKDFLPAKVPVRLKPLAGRPFHQCDMLVLKIVQRHYLKPSNTRKPRLGMGVYLHRRQVALIKLMQFDQQGAAIAAKRRVSRSGRVPEIGSGGIVAGFVGKYAVKNQDLWETLRALQRELMPQFRRVRGHAGVELNEACHGFVTQAIDEGKRSTD